MNTADRIPRNLSTAPYVHVYDPVRDATLCGARVDGDCVAITSAANPEILKVICPDCCARLVAEFAAPTKKGHRQ